MEPMVLDHIIVSSSEMLQQIMLEVISRIASPSIAWYLLTHKCSPSLCVIAEEETTYCSNIQNTHNAECSVHVDVKVHNT